MRVTQRDICGRCAKTRKGKVLAAEAKVLAAEASIRKYKAEAETALDMMDGAGEAEEGTRRHERRKRSSHNYAFLDEHHAQHDNQTRRIDRAGNICRVASGAKKWDCDSRRAHRAAY